MVDTHCHLDSIKEPTAEVVARARQAGVARLATVGMHGESIERALADASEHEGVVAIVGRHPHHTEGFDAAGLEEIERAAQDPGAARSARRVSTTTATGRRARTSGARSRPSSTWPSAPGSRW